MTVVTAPAKHGWSKNRQLREEAKARGDMKYYSGVPCRHGHIGIRYVCGEGACVECRSEAVKASRHLHLIERLVNGGCDCAACQRLRRNWNGEQ
jgi:hypothetical protein